MAENGVANVHVTGTYVTDSGVRVAGTVRFTPSQPLRETATGNLVIPRTRGAVLRLGMLSIDLPATDDPGLTPQNWFYHVVEDFPGGRTFDLQLPRETLGDTVDLADFVPQDLVPPDLTGTIVGPPGPPGEPGPPGILPVQIGGERPEDPSVLVWYEIV